jgi:phosphoenolpyruvate-protein kinase (PTS system EI component)
VVDLSVSPYLVPEIKTILHACDSNEAAKLVKDCLALGTPAEVRSVVTEFMHRRFPEHFLA